MDYQAVGCIYLIENIIYILNISAYWL
jgi:hypothetical protein